MNQTQVRKATGLSLPTISGAEHGDPVTQDTATKLLDFYGLDPAGVVIEEETAA